MVSTRNQVNRNGNNGAGGTNQPTGQSGDTNRPPTMEEMAELLRQAREQLAKNEVEMQQLRYERDVCASEIERAAGSYDRREPSPTRSDAGTTPLHSATLLPAGRCGGRTGEALRSGNERAGGASSGRREEFKFKTFKDCGATVFTGSMGPIASMRWIRQTEMAFQVSKCPNHEKVVCASMMLDKEALDWWDTRIVPQGNQYIASLSWEVFVEMFKQQFCTPWEMQALETEFLNLKKGDQTVDVYARSFTEKLRFCKHLCADDAAQVNRFTLGLPAEHRAVVRMQKTLTEAIGMAKTIEQDLKMGEKKDSVSGFKRKHDDSSMSGSEKKDKGDTSKGGDKKKTGTWCNGCKSVHSGPCSDKTLRCHKCTGIGHMSKDCRGEARCYTCKQTGHRMADCPQARGAEKRDDSPK